MAVAELLRTFPAEIPPRVRVEMLQAQMRDRIESMHLALQGRREARNTLLGQAQDVRACFRVMPPYYHLDIEVTPTAYYAMGGDKFSFAKKERDHGALRYYVEVGIFLTDSVARRSCLVLDVSNPINNMPRFALRQTEGNGFGKEIPLHFKNVLGVRMVHNQFPLCASRVYPPQGLTK